MGSYIPISSKDNFDNNSTDAYLLTTESTSNALRIVGRFDPGSQTGNELPKYPNVGVKVINPGSVTINSVVYNVQKNDIIFNNKELHSDKDDYAIIRGGSSNWSNILFDKTGSGNNSILRIKNPTNGIYRNSGSISGVIKIQCPGIVVANMLMKLKVSISDDNNVTEEYNILVSSNPSGTISNVKHTYIGKNQNPDYVSAVVNGSNNLIIYIGLNGDGSIRSKNLSNCIVDLSNIHISYNITDMTSAIKQWVIGSFNVSVVTSLTELESLNESNNDELVSVSPVVPIASGLINGAICGSATFNGELNVNSTASIKVTGGQQNLKLINEVNNGFLFYPTSSAINNVGTLRYTSGSSNADLKFDGSSGKITYKGYELATNDDIGGYAKLAANNTWTGQNIFNSVTKVPTPKSGSNDLQVVNTEYLTTAINENTIHVSKTSIPAKADLNDYVDTGIYFQSANTSAANGINYPAPLAGVLEVLKYGSMVYQHYTVYSSDTVTNNAYDVIYIRGYYTTGWSPWKKQTNLSDNQNFTGINTVPTPSVNVTNTQIANMAAINQAVTGYVTVNVSTAVDGVLTITPEQMRLQWIEFTGTLTENLVIEFPTGFGKSLVIKNSVTMGSYTISLKKAGYAPLTPLYSGNSLWTFNATSGIYQSISAISGLNLYNNSYYKYTIQTNDNSDRIANTAFVQNVAALMGKLSANNTWTGDNAFSKSPTVPTPSVTVTNTQIANMAAINQAVTGYTSIDVSTAVGGILTITNEQYRLQWLGFIGTLTGDLIIEFPRLDGKTIALSNNVTMGSYNITMRMKGQTSTNPLYSGVSYWILTNTSISRLASLTGTTQYGNCYYKYTIQTNDNSDRIANTEFVQNVAALMGKLAANNTWTGQNTFTGVTKVPTISGTTDSSTNAASTAFVQNVGNLCGKLASTNSWTGLNNFTVSPTVPTPTKGSSDTKVANMAALAAGLADKQNTLGFTPVQQGGGAGQFTNKVYIGWSSRGLLAQVDNTPPGVFAFQDWVNGSFATIPALTANGIGITASGSNANGSWIKFANGFIIQLMSIDIAPYAMSAWLYTLPTPFPSVNYVLSMTSADPDHKQTDYRWAAYAKNDHQYVVYHTLPNTTLPFYIIAMGY